MVDKNNHRLRSGDKVIFWNHGATAYLGLPNSITYLLGTVNKDQDYYHDAFFTANGFIVRVSFGKFGIWNCNKNSLEYLTKAQYVLKKFEE